MSIVSNHVGGLSTVATPTGAYEIAWPFHVDGSGRIGAVIDPVQRAIQHILQLALTVPGERPMRPNYGVGLQYLVFSSSTLADFQAAAQALSQAYQQTDGAYTVMSVTVIPKDAGTYVFAVDFQIAEDPVVHQAVFNYAGQLVGAT